MEFLKSMLVRISDFFSEMMESTFGDAIAVATVIGMVVVLVKAPILALCLFAVSVANAMLAGMLDDSPVGTLLNNALTSIVAIWLLATSPVVPVLVVIIHSVWILMRSSMLCESAYANFANTIAVEEEQEASVDTDAQVA